MKWWQSLAGVVIHAAKDLLDDTQPVEKLQGFLRAGLAQAAPDGSAAKDEAAYAYYLAAKLSLVPEREDARAPHLRLPTQAKFEDWHRRLADERVIGRRGLAPETGLMLLSILDDPRQHTAFLQTELERLLRWVEVKRQAALELAGKHDQISEWLERHAIAILFSRAAREMSDLRYLNAALKLNDWAFPAHQRMRSGPPIARYLWSLAEQETSWKVMVG